jgi:hypothetical protein
MESNAAEAVLNNIIGTQSTARSGRRTPESSDALMVSTDKAVNPDQHHGRDQSESPELMFQARALAAERARASDRLLLRPVWKCSWQSRQRHSDLSASRSDSGGPLTVTDPDVERYFMTIPEAAQLIIQAGAMGRRGEIYLLDMGEPVQSGRPRPRSDSALRTDPGRRYRNQIHRTPPG